MMKWLRAFTLHRGAARPATEQVDAPLPADLLTMFDDFTRDQIERLPAKLRRKIIANRKARVTAVLEREVARARASA